LNLEAICVFAAIGFFLDRDTYWKDEIVLPIASNTILNNQEVLIESKPWFKWHYTPRDITFDEALEEFTVLFETIVKEQTLNKKVILPLSGGLDSRTQAAALKALNSDVSSYSYKFQNGFDEVKIAKQIAQICDFEFTSYTISKGYLWGVLDKLANLNQCFSDFTSPRQMAIYNQFDTNGDVFSLGHWGDVLFDSMNLSELNENEQIDVLLKKLIKKGGLDFASQLWNTWELPGNFEDYLKSRVLEMLKTIDIKDTNARLRAFKSKYWAPRWTSANFSVFEQHKPVSLPYYDNRMCEFICTVPEAYLANRKLQIAYIKQRNPQLAKVTWQDQRPFNLNNFQQNKMPYNLPYKVYGKLKRSINSHLFGKSYVQRNWELQFLGSDNIDQLKNALLNDNLDPIVPQNFTRKYLEAFTKENAVINAHPINVLLVLSKFNTLKHV
jgi:hypothetical protein